MSDYYMDGEERFGWVGSPVYWLLSKIPSMRLLHRFVLHDLSSLKSKKILDIGTGPGDIPIELSKLGNFKKIYGVDPSDAMLAIAKHRAGGANNLFFRKGSSRKLPFDKKFDIIISVLSFHHWEMKEFSLRYISRFLKEKGELRIYEFQRPKLRGLHKIFVPQHSVTKEELYGIAKRAGLRIKEMKEQDHLIRATFVKS